MIINETATSTAKELVLNRLKNVQAVGDNKWDAQCPAHDDGRNSLSVSTGDDGRVLLHCHAGCGQQAVVDAIGIGLKDLFPPKQRAGKPRGRIVETYPYRDSDGSLLFEVCRFDPKDFRQRRPDGNGGHIWKLNGLRRVLFRLPDNDDPGRQHAAKVAELLHSVAASVKIVNLPDLPDHGDVSDWIDGGGTADKLNQLVADAACWEPEPEAVVSDEPPEAEDDPHRLARVCLESLPIIRRWREEFYAYSTPAYCVVSDDEVKGWITTAIKAEFDRLNDEARKEWSPTKKDRQPPVAHKVTRALVSNVIQALESLVIVPYAKEQPVWLDCEPSFPAEECLVTQNGILHPPSLVMGRPSLVQPTPNLFTTNAVNYSFDPQAECPQWLKFLDDLWKDDRQQVNALQEILGYVLLPDTSQQKMFMFIGPKRSGKSTIAKMIRGVVGEQNCCAPVLGSLQGDFGLQPLLGKSVGVIGDARLSGRSDAAVIVERLLSITGEDSQTVNRKHRPAVTTQLRIRFVLISNELPSLRDASATLPSRMILLRMTRSFYGEEDHGLSQRLLSERPGILRWALTGWQRLRDRGHFVQPESSRELLDGMEELCSPITSFVRQCCRVEPGGQVFVKDAYAGWKVWCDGKGRKPGTEQTFGRDLRAAVPSLSTSQPRIGGRRVRCYNGLQLTEIFDGE